ncbi:MAG: 30S ribosomal protein S9 [Nanoarchaeota archaeon]|nr:30S ribosomal protein S9 [Nanoarchaeota archaeon]MBU1705056.1 30S ribosomal protein S9 [Nanoarchaeota archaeon]
MKTIYTSGKRKTAKARATLKDGKGLIRVNNVLLDLYEPKIYRMKFREPILIAGDIVNSVDIDVNVSGGGIASQADAGRLAIAKALVAHSKGLKNQFLKYDRTLLVADVRRKENAKPNRHGKARAKVQKSYR